MADFPAMTERHEVRVPGVGQTIVFVADSEDGRLIIRQERPGHDPEDVCSISLSNPQELRGFFNGLRRILASLGQRIDAADAGRGSRPDASPRAILPRPSSPLAAGVRGGGGGAGGAGAGESARADAGAGRGEQDREALVAQARQRNPQAFAPWSRDEEEEIRRRHANGESIATIARAHRRSPRAIELRLQRLGVLPPAPPE